MMSWTSSGEVASEAVGADLRMQQCDKMFPTLLVIYIWISKPTAFESYKLQCSLSHMQQLMHIRLGTKNNKADSDVKKNSCYYNDASHIDCMLVISAALLAASKQCTLLCWHSHIAVSRSKPTAGAQELLLHGLKSILCNTCTYH